MPDKVQPKDNSKTGVMPRVELEPELHHETPPPSMPEILDEGSSTTGEMPVVTDTADDPNTRDDDDPNGK